MEKFNGNINGKDYTSFKEFLNDLANADYNNMSMSYSFTSTDTKEEKEEPKQLDKFDASKYLLHVFHLNDLNGTADDDEILDKLDRDLADKRTKIKGDVKKMSTKQKNEVCDTICNEQAHVDEVTEQTQKKIDELEEQQQKLQEKLDVLYDSIDACDLLNDYYTDVLLTVSE